jgi:TonB family protein
VKPFKQCAIRVTAITLLAAACSAQGTSPQNSPTGEISSLLSTAGTQAMLEREATAPYHLQATFQTFDIEGKPDGSGSIEAYWDGKSRWRHTVTYRNLIQTTVEDRALYRSADEFHSSASERLLVESMFSPIPVGRFTTEKHDLASKKTTLSTVEMDCVSVRNKPAPSNPNGPPLRPVDPSVYCLDSKSHTLRLSELPGQMTVVFNKFETFGSRQIPHSVVISQGKVQRATLDVVKVTEWQPDDAMFPHLGETPVSERRARVAGGVLAGSIIQKVSPEYPYLAKREHIQGTVVLACVITKLGTVSDIEVLSSPDHSLSEAAVEAVKHWTYKPYLINGQPIDVDSTITVNFNLGTR